MGFHGHSALQDSVKATDIERRSRNSYTTPSYGVVSHGALIEGIRVFADHTRGNRRKQKASMISTHHTAFQACLPSRSNRSTYAPDESRLFWSEEKPEYPHFEPFVEIKMAQALGSPVYICGQSTSFNRAFSKMYIDVAATLKSYRLKN